MADPLDRMGLWLDADAKPISLRQWAELVRNKSYSVVAQTRVTEDIEVSTVWLGLDYNFLRYFPGHEADPPLTFETMVFVRTDTPRRVFGRVIERDGTECYHWPTREVALANHMRIVAELRACVDVEITQEPVE